jgi:hypothetical protein
MFPEIDHADFIICDLCENFEFHLREQYIYYLNVIDDQTQYTPIYTSARSRLRQYIEQQNWTRVLLYSTRINTYRTLIGREEIIEFVLNHIIGEDVNNIFAFTEEDGQRLIYDLGINLHDLDTTTDAASAANYMEPEIEFHKITAVMDTSISESKETIVCSICLEENIPIRLMLVTECNHSFCKECIISHIDESHKKCKNPPCPLCRNTIQQIKTCDDSVCHEINQRYENVEDYGTSLNIYM